MQFWCFIAFGFAVLTGHQGYRARLGQWRAAALKCSCSGGLRYVIQLVLPIFLVMQHVQFKLMKTTYPHGIFLEFLWRGYGEICQDFHKLASEVAWTHLLLLAPSKCDKSKIIGLVLWFTAHCYCDFVFRFAHLGSYPNKIFWLVLEEPEVACDIRKRIAAELLTSPSSKLGNTTGGVGIRTRPDCQAANS